MAGIEGIDRRVCKNGRVSYRVRVRCKGLPIQSATFPKLKEARQWKAATETAIREKRFFPTESSQRHTLGEAVERYRNEELRHLTDQKNRLRQLQCWQAHLGALTLGTLSNRSGPQKSDSAIRWNPA